MLVNQDFTGSENCMGSLQLSFEDSLDNNTRIAAKYSETIIHVLVKSVELLRYPSFLGIQILTCFMSLLG